jgi:hypothetical protein
LKVQSREKVDDASAKERRKLLFDDGGERRGKEFIELAKKKKGILACLKGKKKRKASQVSQNILTHSWTQQYPS